MNSKNSFPLHKKISFFLIVYFMIFLCCEVIVRIYRGKLFSFTSTQVSHEIRKKRFKVDPILGWTNLPKSNTADNYISEGIVSINADGFRDNGNGFKDKPPYILAVGDSTTFGDEVRDNETWPSQLELIIGRRVINGGVSGYGLDQAILRTEAILKSIKPEWVILTFIPDSVERSEHSVIFGIAKPTFNILNNKLSLKLPPKKSMLWDNLRFLLGYSHFIDIIMDFIAPKLQIPWNYHYSVREHKNGPAVIIKLINRFVDVVEASGAKPLIIYIHYPTWPPVPQVHPVLIHKNRIDPIISHIRKHRIMFIDIGKELERYYRSRLDSNIANNFYQKGWHFSPIGNKWLADQIALIVSQTKN